MWSFLESFDELFDDLSYDFWGKHRNLSSSNFDMTHKDVDGSFITTVELPGFEEKDIKVELLPAGMISIKAERRAETSWSSVTKCFSVPKDVDGNQLAAELKDGVLTLKMPIKKLPIVPETKQIPISVGK